MQGSSSSSNKGYAPGGSIDLGPGHAPFISSSSPNGTTGSRAEIAPGIEQRVKEMGYGAERVVTKPVISEQQARQPVQEFTEFIEKPKIEQPTQYVTQQRVMEKDEAPIKLKQQEIQQVQQNTVIQEQPVIVKKQEVQIEKEVPIQVTKHVTQHQTLPAIEKKELFIQPVQHTPGPERVLSKATTEAGVPVEYKVKCDASSAEAIDIRRSDKHGVVGQIKDTMGGVKAAAHGVIQNAREKAREVFHSGSSDEETRRETKST